jgi:elongation factor P
MKAKDVRRGTVLLYNNAPYRVLDYQHITPGKGNAKCWFKMRNLINGLQAENSVMSVEELETADVYNYKATFLYSDADGYHFMGVDNFEEVTLSAEALGDHVYYLQDQMQVDVTTFNEQPIGINIPTTVVLTVVETEPEVKGGTVTSSGKPAKLDTGLTVTVPAFVKEGDRIVVNTEEGKYLGRSD